eukprot:NODE_1311_length_1476_cov_16.311843_g1089_i0.p12 GENE.NODE_1311_length_1476_cov_16.311843_g1089_i0~~NODE_1311_length_1476_cov_16.311843_g1089_i0.p12  ORF type:complete len:57 (+),score=2.09 NODE_1311_length_1476_cov_16.311843_g1089_i0:484-654(+)
MKCQRRKITIPSTTHTAKPSLPVPPPPTPHTPSLSNSNQTGIVTEWGNREGPLSRS